jgi:FkbM family methyltransferase
MVPNYKYPHTTVNLVELGYALLRGSKSSNFNIVQIGVFDGKVSDPLKDILSNGNNNVNVLLVEPQPNCFKELGRMYGSRPGFSLENVAITEQDGPIMLHLPNGEDTSPKASLDKSHFSRFNIAEKNLRSIQVEGLTIKSLLKKHQAFNDIDLLQIDTEGLDYKILRQFLDLNILPKIVNIESFHLDKSERELLRKDLTDRQYEYMDVEYDTFSVHKSLLTNG